MWAQLRSIKGIVVDANTGNPLAGATIICIPYGTSSNSYGQFTLLTQHGAPIKCTCVGYQPQTITLADSVILKIKLKPQQVQLNEVVIADNESLIHKAIRKIPQNYPATKFVQQGIIRIVDRGKDSLGYKYFYKDSALIASYYPSYQSASMPKITVLAKKDTQIILKNSSFNSYFVNGYLIGDYVLSRTDFLKQNTRNYIYVLSGKSTINHHRVYVLNFYAANTHDARSGTLYIDTASLAFVRIAFTAYHVKHLGFIENDKQDEVVDYRLQNGKWQLYQINENATAHHSGYLINMHVDYLFLKNDTNAKPLPFGLQVPTRTEHALIQAQGNWPDSANINNTMRLDTVFKPISIPVIDTSGNEKRNWKRTIIEYLRHDNIRTDGIDLTYSPINFSGNQALLNSNVQTISNLMVQWIDVQLRVKQHLNLFIEYATYNNMGIGGISIKQNKIQLFYEFNFNKLGHSISIAPFTGYSRLTAHKQEQDYANYKAWQGGLLFYRQISHRLRLHFAATYYNFFNTYNAGLSNSEQHYTASLGLIFR